jgi:hypothetical protein
MHPIFQTYRLQSTVYEPCDIVGDLGGDGLDLRSELVPLREEAIGVGEVSDVEHGIVVGQVLDQPVGGHLCPGLEPLKLTATVLCPLEYKSTMILVMDKIHLNFHHCILTSPMSPKITTR